MKQSQRKTRAFPQTIKRNTFHLLSSIINWRFNLNIGTHSCVQTSANDYDNIHSLVFDYIVDVNDFLDVD